MDDRWESEVIEYGAVNITGFRVIDTKRKYVRDFLDGWRKLDSLSTTGTGRDSISVSIFFLYFGTIFIPWLLSWWVLYWKNVDEQSRNKIWQQKKTEKSLKINETLRWCCILIYLFSILTLGCLYKKIPRMIISPRGTTLVKPKKRTVARVSYIHSFIHNWQVGWLCFMVPRKMNNHIFAANDSTAFDERFSPKFNTAHI